MRKILITKKEIKDIKNQYAETVKIVTENFSTFIKYKSGTISPYVLNEDVSCPCPDGTKSIKCCKTDVKLEKHVNDSIVTINHALASGLKLKLTASSPKNQIRWTDVVNVNQLNMIKNLLPNMFTTFVPEVVSGLLPGFSFNNELIDLASKISDLSGLELQITGGNDFFHKGLTYNSTHKTGEAIDFLPTAGMNNVNDKKIEEAVISIISSGNYGNRIGFINERLNPSGAATAPHFHLSLTNNTKYSWFAYIDNNGKSYSKLPPTSKHLTWKNGGKYPELTKSYHNTDEKEVKPPVVKTDYQQYNDGDIYIPAGNISDKTRVNNIYKKGL